MCDAQIMLGQTKPTGAIQCSNISSSDSLFRCKYKVAASNKPGSIPLSTAKQLPELSVELLLKSLSFRNLLHPPIRTTLIKVPVTKLQKLQRRIFASVRSTVGFEKVVAVSEDLTSEVLWLTKPTDVAIQTELLKIGAASEEREGGEVHCLVCSATIAPTSDGDIGELQTIRGSDGCEKRMETHRIRENDRLLVKITNSFSADLFAYSEEVR